MNIHIRPQQIFQPYKKIWKCHSSPHYVASDQRPSYPFNFKGQTESWGFIRGCLLVYLFPFLFNNFISFISYWIATALVSFREREAVQVPSRSDSIRLWRPLCCARKLLFFLLLRGRRSIIVILSRIPPLQYSKDSIAWRISELIRVQFLNPLLLCNNWLLLD